MDQNELLTPENCPDSGSYPAQTSSTNPSKPTPVVCTICEHGQALNRMEDWKRHMLSKHLPDWIQCTKASCPWRGSRLDAYKKHLKEFPKHGHPDTRLKREQYEIYDIRLVLPLVREDSAPFEVVREYAVAFVKERARELEKEKLWEII
ncbi:hypothetical protein BC827DRAFT_1264150 [Russula dissimulans]|nr:hypothetical protein BC827DRAFT_1264150 [Russula dissimulans]